MGEKLNIDFGKVHVYYKGEKILLGDLTTFRIENEEDVKKKVAEELNYQLWKIFENYDFDIIYSYFHDKLDVFYYILPNLEDVGLMIEALDEGRTFTEFIHDIEYYGESDYGDEFNILANYYVYLDGRLISVESDVESYLYELCWYQVVNKKGTEYLLELIGRFGSDSMKARAKQEVENYLDYLKDILERGEK